MGERFDLDADIVFVSCFPFVETGGECCLRGEKVHHL